MSTSTQQSKAPRTAEQDRWVVVAPLRVIDPRPRGVFWAAVPDPKSRTATGGGLCVDPAHPVYVCRRPLDDHTPGCQGNDTARQFFVCYVCAPPPERLRQGLQSADHATETKGVEHP